MVLRKPKAGPISKLCHFPPLCARRSLALIKANSGPVSGVAKGEMKRGDAATKTSKAELVAALKASSEFCDSAYSGMTDAEGATVVKTPLGSKSKLGLLNFNVAHDNEMYGTIAVYLRLKGLVPPSTEGAAAAQKAK
jgi:hypothetical protein